MLRGVPWSILLVFTACGHSKPNPSEPQARTAADPTAATPATHELPADAVASVDGTLIPYSELAAFYEAAALDRETDVLSEAEAQQLLEDAMDVVLYRALLLAEFERLGLDDEARTRLAAEFGPRLSMILSMIPLELALGDTRFPVTNTALALQLALANGAHVVSEAALSDAYERRKHELTSSTGWVRLDRLELGYTTSPIATTGVAACDDLLLRWHACVETPGTKLDPEAVEKMESTIRQGFGAPEQKAFVTQLCSAIAAEMASEPADALGCEWEPRPSAPLGRAQRAALAKGRAASGKRAAVLQRRATAKDVDFLALAGAEQGVTVQSTLVAIDELEPEIARAIETLHPPGVTAPVAGATRWTIARVQERWPAGPAPLELRRGELSDTIIAAQLTAAMSGLYERLRASHRVVVRLPPPPKLPPRQE